MTEVLNPIESKGSSNMDQQGSPDNVDDIESTFTRSDYILLAQLAC